MGIAKIYNQKQSGISINGIIEDYYAYAGENISAGDFVEFINGIAGSTSETSVDTPIIEGIGAGYIISAVKLSTNKVFIAHGDNSSVSNSKLYGVVCVITNTTITYGTDTKLTTGTCTGNYTSLVALSDNKVFIAHTYGTDYYLYGMVVTIDGTTVIAGTDTSLSAVKYAGYYSISSELLPSGNIFIAHCYGSNRYLYGIVISINGTTITKGTDTALSSTACDGEYKSTAPISVNNVFVAYGYSSSYYLHGMICSISGTTITKGEDTSLSGFTATGSSISALKLSDTSVFVAHGYKTYYLYGVVCTINGTTITRGEDTVLIDATYTGEVIATELLKNGKIFVAHSYGSSSNYFLHGIICMVSGTTITNGTDTRLSDTSYTGYEIASVLLDGSNVFLAHNYKNSSTNSYDLYAQIWGVDETNNVPTNNVTTAQYETQVRKATTSDIYGVAKTSGMGAYKVVEYTIPEGESVSEGENRKYTIETTVDGDIIPKTWTAINDRYKYKSDDGIIIDLSSDATFKSDGQNVIDACDGNETSYFQANNAIPMNITFDFPEAIKILKLRIKYNSSNPSLTIYGSNDGGETLEKLFEKAKTTGTTTSTVTVAFEKPDYYKQYIVSLDIGGYAVYNKVYEIQVLKYMTANSFSGTALQSGTAGDTIQIAVPVTDEESTGHKDIVSIYTVEQTLASLPVGTLVKDPNSTFLGEPVIWKIADVNHEGYPSNSVTLISDKILAMRAFDTMEPNNSDSDRATAGNNRYSVSNIRQWLNSDAEAGQWYSAQHSADTPPSSSYAWNYGTNAYDTKAGFLNSFSQNFKNALLDTTLTVVLNTVTDGGGSENVIDKIFLASNTETGVSNENNIAEGSLLAVFSDNTSRKAYCTTEAINDSNYSGDPANDTTAWSWWLRTPSVGYSKYTRYITNAGAVAYDDSHASIRGVRPLCNIPSSIKVIQDEDGVYKLDF